MKRKIFLYAGVLLAVVMMPILARAQSTQPTVEQLQAQLQALIEQLKVLQGSSGLNEQAVSEENFGFIATFEKNLYFGMKNDPDVKNLQEFLTERGEYSGPITGNFFLLTLGAVKKFQTASGVNPTGYFGVKSREAANKIIGGLVQTEALQESTALSVAQNQPQVFSTGTTTDVSIIPLPSLTSASSTATTTPGTATSTPPATVAPSISISYPVGGENWSAGSTYTLNWAYHGTFPSNQITALYLLKGGQTKNAWLSYASSPDAWPTSYPWTIPTSVEAGSDYQIQIVDYNAAYGTLSASKVSPYFSVSAPVSATPATTTTPTTPPAGTPPASGGTASSTSAYVNLTSSATTVNDGNPVTLSWTSSQVTSCTAGGDWTGNQATYGTYLTGSLYASAGSYTFSLSCTGTSGTVNSSVTVTVNPAAPVFTLQTPVDQETLTMGKAYTIKWTVSDNTGILSTARLSLYKNNSYQDFIAVDVPNNGSYNWNIPTSLATGNDYQIRIWNISYPNNFKDSPKFNLNAPATSYSGNDAAALASMLQTLAALALQVKQLASK